MNLAVGAASLDSNLLGFSSGSYVPLITYYSSQLFIQWMKRVTSISATIPTDIKFNYNSGSKILVTMNGNPF